MSESLIVVDASVYVEQSHPGGMYTCQILNYLRSSHQFDPIEVGHCLTNQLRRFLKDAKGNPLKDTPIQIKRNGPIVTSSNDGIGETPLQASTNRSGYFEIELVRGISVTVIIHNQGWSKTFTVPDQSNIEYFSIT